MILSILVIFVFLIAFFSKVRINTDGSSEISGLKIPGVVDLKVVDES